MVQSPKGIIFTNGLLSAVVAASGPATHTVVVLDISGVIRVPQVHFSNPPVVRYSFTGSIIKCSCIPGIKTSAMHEHSASRIQIKVTIQRTTPLIINMLQILTILF